MTKNILGNFKKITQKDKKMANRKLSPAMSVQPYGLA